MEFGGKRTTRKRTIKSLPRPQGVSRRTLWFWCWGDNARKPLPRKVALGPFATEAEAQEQGFTAYPNGCRIYKLDTINLEKAKQKLKVMDIKEGKTIDEAMRRASGKLP